MDSQRSTPPEYGSLTTVVDAAGHGWYYAGRADVWVPMCEDPGSIGLPAAMSWQALNHCYGPVRRPVVRQRQMYHHG